MKTSHLSPLALLLVAVLAPAAQPARIAVVEKAFAAPPSEARAWVLWFWLSGNITRDGITTDLEAFRSAGAGGVLLMSGSLVPQYVQPTVEFMSAEWRALFVHAVRECDRLGMKLVVHNCDGWSESGGKWVTPEMAMQRVVSAELRLRGPRRFTGELPQPYANKTYGDVAVLAYRTPPGDAWTMAEMKPKLSTNGGENLPLDKLTDGNAETGVKLDEKGSVAASPEGLWLRIDFDRPVKAGAIHYAAAQRSIKGGYYVTVESEATLQASTDGRHYADVCKLPPSIRNLGDQDVWTRKTASFPPVEAQFWRIQFRPRFVPGVDLREVELLAGTRVHRWEDKSAQVADFITPTDGTPATPRERAIDPASTVELTSRVDAHGVLTWDVPAGDWTVLRIGHTWTGGFVQPASGGRSPEVDKMDRAAVEHHFRSFLGKVIEDVGPLAGKTFAGVEMDSWEAGSSNWTPGMLDEFRRRRGYDAGPYLPVLAGRVVADAERSDRFLFDFRRTISELIADTVFSHYRSMLLPHKMGLWAESFGPTIQKGRIQYEQAADSLLAKGRLDVPMGEFWVAPPPQFGEPAFDTKEAASAAHIYGKPIAAAEAFTAFAHVGWKDYPSLLKTLGDLEFTLGINRFVLSESVHQPWPERFPGLTLGDWGMRFQRSNTWFPLSRGWLDYLSRCQYLLQQGRFTADIAYYLGEDSPVRLWGGSLGLQPPAGYDYDGFTIDALLNRFKVSGHRLVLPDGMSYRVLVLPDSRRMTPPVLRKLTELVEQGATVIGPKPDASPSLVGYPACDTEVKKLAAALWGDVDGRRATERRVGQGRIVWGQSLQEVLRAANVAPDFEYTGEAKDAKLAYIHRALDDSDIYFVSNQREHAEKARCTFRIAGKQPEIWDAVTGERRDAVEFTETNGRTTVPLEFAPAQSWFIVFTKPSAGARRIGRNFPVCSLVSELNGPWKVRFQPRWGGPESVLFEKLDDWSRRAEEGIKHYSGTATYEKELNVPESALESGKRLYLDLGQVRNIAEVRLNGKHVAYVWTAPWRADITGEALAGTNQLQIVVANSWVNRLVGDKKLPAEKRLAWTTSDPYKADTPLEESGLLGPVTLQQR
jgi:hypothetical protein